VLEAMMRSKASKVGGRSAEAAGKVRIGARRVSGVLGFAVLALVVGSADVAVAGNTGDLILNEFNACGDVFFLRNGGSDPFLGQVQGNGGNWVELVVITDHLDIRGWTLEWRNADPDSGSVIFQDHPIWSDLRSGTLITVREDDLSPPGFGVLLTDLSYDPAQGDYWIHANVDDLTVVSQFGFKVDDDNWQMRILDESLTIIQGWTGETTPLWGGGGGVAGDELGKLEEDPSAAAAGTPPSPNYNDGTSSTFGSENHWLLGSLIQDFCVLRDSCVEPPHPVLPALSARGVALLAVVLVSLGLWGKNVRGRRR
jgi:hypothetical protein